MTDHECRPDECGVCIARYDDFEDERSDEGYDFDALAAAAQ